MLNVDQQSPPIGRAACRSAINIGNSAFLLLFLAAHTWALTSATLVGPDLKPQPVQIQGLQRGQLSYFDSNRDLRHDRLDRFVQIRDLPGASTLAGLGDDATSAVSADAGNRGVPGVPAVPGVVELTDGQRVAGTWRGASKDGQALLWAHALLGPIAIDLEQISAVVFGTAVGHDHDDVLIGDVLWLSNGDALKGLLVSVLDSAIEWQPAGVEGDPLVTPLARVRAIKLANRPTAPDRQAHLVWLGDGSRLRVRTMSFTRDSVLNESTMPHRFAPSAAAPPEEATPRHIGFDQMARIDIASARWRLADLSSAKMDVVAGGKVFGVLMPPRVDTDVIWMHAPVTVRFDLPPGAVRFAATAALAVDHDTVEAPWADLELIFRSDRKIVARRHLSSDHRSTLINVPVRGPDLTVEVDAATNGPVMDRLWLRNSVLLIEDPSPAIQNQDD